MLEDDYGPFSGPTTSFAPPSGPRVGDVQLEISIYTKEFVVARVNEAVNAALVVFYVFTGKNAGQYLEVTNGIDFSKKTQQVFTGKLTLVEKKSVTKHLTSSGIIMDAEKLAYSSAKAVALTIRHVLRTLTFISVYSGEIDRSVLPLTNPPDVAADMFVKLITGDRELVEDLRYLCSIFFADKTLESFVEKMFKVQLAAKSSRPSIGDDAAFEGFVGEVLMLKRVMGKILIYCQDRIPFLSAYGLDNMNSVRDSIAGVVDITAVRLLSVEVSSRRNKIKDGQWYGISQSPEFYKVCTPAVPNTCPLFKSAESFFLDSRGVFVHPLDADAFKSSTFMATAYLLSRAYAHERADPSKMSNVSLDAFKALEPASKGGYQLAMESLSDVLFRLYSRRPDIQRRFDKKDPENNLLVTDTEPVIARAVYTRELAALQFHPRPEAKVSADRIVFVRRIMCAAVLLASALKNEPRYLAYRALTKLSEQEVIRAASPIYSGITEFPIPLLLL